MTEHITCLSEVAITRDPFEASVKSRHSPTPSRRVAPITLDSQGQSFAVVQRSLARLSLPYFSPLPLTHSISATLPSLVPHKHHKLIPTSGPLHSPLPLPRILASLLCTKLTYSSHLELYSLSYPHRSLPWPSSLKFSKIPTYLSSRSLKLLYFFITQFSCLTLYFNLFLCLLPII